MIDEVYEMEAMELLQNIFPRETITDFIFTFLFTTPLPG
jgi:hypothetical protein